MTLRLRPLPHPDSFVARLDPRWKLAAMIVAALAVSCLRGLVLALVALAAALILVGLGRLSLRWYLSRLGALALFLLLFVAFAPLLIRSDDRVFPLGPLALPSAPGRARRSGAALPRLRRPLSRPGRVPDESSGRALLPGHCGRRGGAGGLGSRAALAGGPCQPSR